ncbi:MAG: hypothetical protein WBA93_24060 [Microcoleaceae cyanobacterium]
MTKIRLGVLYGSIAEGSSNSTCSRVRSKAPYTIKERIMNALMPGFCVSPDQIRIISNKKTCLFEPWSFPSAFLQAKYKYSIGDDDDYKLIFTNFHSNLTSHLQS